MSASTFPLTPAPSADISGKSDTRPARLEGTFSLPPAAMASSRSGSSGASTVSSGSSESSYRPISPSSPAAGSKPAPPSSDKRSKHSHSATSSEAFSLPPPPTRARKIIQMKPRTQETQPARKDQGTTQAATSKSTTSPASVAGTKRKQPNGSAAAGRKVARKTAHSLIERRRRSKMNDEFSVLKNMIPACAGQQMHKLAILQASIEYMRYLEQCVSDLQAANAKSHMPSSRASERRRTSQAPPSAPPKPPDADPDDEDHDMSDAPSASTTTATSHPTPLPSSSLISPTSTTTSPALPASNASSALPSPAFSGAPQGQHSSTTLPSLATFALTSPALVPQRDREDHEATAALLMLGEDRRWDARDTREGKGGSATGSGTGAGAGGQRKGRGMSVRDLLRE